MNNSIKLNASEIAPNGLLRELNLFIHLFNKIPNKQVYSIADNCFDLTTLDLDALKKLYPDYQLYKTGVKSEEPSESNEDSDIYDEETDAYVFGEWQTSIIRIVANDRLIVIDEDGIAIYYGEGDAEQEIDNILNIIKRKAEKPKEAEVRLVAYSNEFYTIKSKINPMHSDIEKNYNDDFKSVYKDIVNFLDTRESGVIILRGVPGSGKTSLVKTLITEHPKNYIIMTNEMAGKIASPDFISFMMNHKDSVFILEDCEQILMERNSFTVSSALSSILNMSDGILSDIFNIKFICTFNADITKIDQALLRKGRCYANYEFNELDVEKTKKLLNEQGIELDEYKPLTLAEIYNYEDSDCTVAKTTKIGFNV